MSSPVTPLRLSRSRSKSLSTTVSSPDVLTPETSSTYENSSASSPSQRKSPTQQRWRPSTRRYRNQCSRTVFVRPLRHSALARLVCALIILSILFSSGRLLHLRTPTTRQKATISNSLANHVLYPVISPKSNNGKPNTKRWLENHSSGYTLQSRHGSRSLRRPQAAIISLVRNEELNGILQSMRQLEHRWNKAYKYPWMFFSEQPFNDEFKMATANATTAEVSYHLIPRSHWSTPEWVNMDQYMDSLDYLDAISVGKGYMLSYRNMCRWNSGFFYKHPALQNYDYYWRVEPDVHFLCDIPYDPFAFMADNKLIYGFNMNILDDARSFASLWKKTMTFARKFPNLIHEDADLAWLIDQHNAGEYNNCQFFSNFEIGDLNFFRSEANEAYFKYLDESGGFYYERFGDAPVHTLSVALFAPKHRVWFFRDIGYQHDIARHCPLEGVRSGRCDCEPTPLDENFYKLVPMESPQRKPGDTCIRQWLGGPWLDTKRGWTQEAERLLGGDGYGGYIKTEMSIDDN